MQIISWWDGPLYFYYIKQTFSQETSAFMLEDFPLYRWLVHMYTTTWCHTPEERTIDTAFWTTNIVSDLNNSMSCTFVRMSLRVHHIGRLETS